LAVLRRNSRAHGILRAVDRRHPKHCDVASAALVCLVTPGVGQSGFGVPAKGEHLDYAIPHRLALEGFVYRLCAEVRAVHAVQVANGFLESLHVGGHAAMSTRSPTVMGLLTTPASIAGVHRMLRWNRTK